MSTTTSTILDRFDPQEVVAAAQDYLAIAFGQAKTAATFTHWRKASICQPFNMPLGLSKRQARQQLKLKQIAAGSGGNCRSIKLFGDNTMPIVLRSYQAASQIPFAATLGLPNFKPQHIYAFDVAHGLTHVRESASTPRRRALDASAHYTTAYPQSYGQIFELNRNDLLTNDINSLLNLPRGAGALVAQVEAGLLAAAVEGAPALSDGDVFDTSNTVAQALSADSLGVAVGALRKQGAPGAPLNIAPRHLVVEPDLKMLARKADPRCRPRVPHGVRPAWPGRWPLAGSRRSRAGAQPNAGHVAGRCDH